MKDRTRLTHQKKASHRLRNAMISIALITAVLSTGSAIVLYNVSKENTKLTAKIEGYNMQIDYLEKQNDENLLKHNNRNP